MCAAFLSFFFRVLMMNFKKANNIPTNQPASQPANH